MRRRRHATDRETLRPAASLSRRALLRGVAAAGLGAAAGTFIWSAVPSVRAAAPAKSQASAWQPFDAAVHTAMQTFDIVGAAVAVVTTDGILHHQTFGVRDRASGAPVTPGTLFRAASTTKSMSALLVATSVDEGRLGWDQPVREAWPAFRAPTAELTDTLRVRDLLGMATGLGAGPLADLQQGYPNPRQLLESVTSLPVLAPPNTIFYYNNTVYALGGYLPALVLGTEPEELLAVHTRQMQERVFEPVGMVTARKGDDPRPFSDDYATGYALDLEQGMTAEPWATVGSFAPIGGTFVSLTDMAAYITLQLRGGTTPAGRRVVSAENLAACWQPTIEIPVAPEAAAAAPAVSDVSYCRGWILTRYRGGQRVLSHTGGEDGFICIIAFLPDDDLGLVVLTNTFTGGPAFVSYLLNLLMEQRFGLAADNDVLIAQYHDTTARLAEQASQAVPVDPTAVAPYLGYYEEGVRLAFDGAGSLRLHLQNRAWRVLGQPDGSYVGGSGLLAGAPINFRRDAVGVPQLELQGTATLRWQSGLD
jgi:CubicO group peptidase (beta-lactamase class C family)